MSELDALEARYEKANDAVEKAMEQRDDAIQGLVEAEMAFHEALDAWSPLYDELKALDPSRGVTEYTARRRRKMN